VANEFIDLIGKINQTIRSDRGLKIALSTTLAVHKQRIFVEGGDAKGTKIGTYSTKPISISKKNQARQTGKTFFKGGYAEYKRAVGKNPGFVNLRNTDQMMMDYGLIGSSLQYGFGFNNTENFKKVNWMEEKYRKEIFFLTKKEEDVLTSVLSSQINQAIR
jgi:hypothetical protein